MCYLDDCTKKKEKNSEKLVLNNKTSVLKLQKKKRAKR